MVVSCVYIIYNTQASRIQDTYGQRGLSLRLSLACLDILLDYCRANAELRLMHPEHYEALLSSRTQINNLVQEHRLAERTMYTSTFGLNPRLKWQLLGSREHTYIHIYIYTCVSVSRS